MSIYHSIRSSTLSYRASHGAHLSNEGFAGGTMTTWLTVVSLLVSLLVLASSRLSRPHVQGDANTTQHHQKLRHHDKPPPLDLCFKKEASLLTGVPLDIPSVCR